MDIITRSEKIKNKKIPNFTPGSIDHIFYYNQKCSTHEYGDLPTIIKLTPEQNKKNNNKKIN